MNENQKNTHKLSLIVAILVPFIVIAVVALSIFLPTKLERPSQDFLYSTNPEGSDTYFNSPYSTSKPVNYVSYDVINGKITKVKSVYDDADPKLIDVETGKPIEIVTIEPDLFVYDVETDTTQKVTFEEAKNLVLTGQYENDEGFTVSIDYGRNTIPPFYFNSDGSSSIYIKGKYSSYKAEIAVPENYWNDFRFISWIKNK